METCGAVRVDTPPNWSLCTVLDPILVPAGPFSPSIVSIDGNTLPQAPKWTVNWTAGYEHPVGNGSVYVFTDWYYRSKVNFFLYESVEFSDDKLLEGGLRIGYKTTAMTLPASFGTSPTTKAPSAHRLQQPHRWSTAVIWGVEVGVKF